MKWLVMIVGGIFVGVLAATMVVSNQSPQQVGGNDASDALSQTHDLLVPKLMSGEIRLRETEAAVKAVAR